MDQKQIIQIGTVSNIYFDQRMIRIASSLQNLGYNVNVFYRPYVKYGKIEKNENYFPFKTSPLKVFFNQGILFYLFYNLALIFKLIWTKTYVFYAVDSDTLLAFTILSKLKRKPLIYDAHEYYAEVPELEGQPLKKKIWHTITQWGINQSSLCLTVSNTLAERLNQRYQKTFQVLRNLPLTQIFENTQKEEKPTIIYQGALNKGRGLELLIKAMKKLNNWQCWIVGEGDLSSSLRALKTSLNADNVIFLGIVSPEELKSITPKCFVGYNLLDDKSLSYQDSLSNKFFDYMHAGVPSISSYLPEYISLNNEWKCGVCIQNDEIKLINTLEEWIKNPEEYALFQNNAIIASRILCWENESQKLEKWLKNML
jgi:glycosyltransferase involved in cell wall biosynthesis